MSPFASLNAGEAIALVAVLCLIVAAVFLWTFRRSRRAVFETSEPQEPYKRLTPGALRSLCAQRLRAIHPETVAGCLSSTGLVAYALHLLAVEQLDCLEPKGLRIFDHTRACKQCVAIAEALETYVKRMR